MKLLTLAQAESMLRDECIIAPITIQKVIKVFKDTDHIHQALDMYHNGLFGNYHMLPGNGGLEF